MAIKQRAVVREGSPQPVVVGSRAETRRASRTGGCAPPASTAENHPPACRADAATRRHRRRPRRRLRSLRGVLRGDSFDEFHVDLSFRRVRQKQIGAVKPDHRPAPQHIASRRQPPRQIFDRPGERRTRAHCPQILRTQLHTLEYFFITWDFRVNWPSQSVRNLLR
jgi:hypothetical protein